MSFSVNKFSSRLLPAKNHTSAEAIVTILFFLIILVGLLIPGYEVGFGGLVIVYVGAIVVISIALITELYFFYRKLFKQIEIRSIGHTCQRQIQACL